MTDNQTLANAKNWLNDAREVNGSFSTPFPPPVFLIGTKKDLLVSVKQDGNPMEWTCDEDLFLYLLAF